MRCVLQVSDLMSQISTVVDMKRGVGQSPEPEVSTPIWKRGMSLVEHGPSHANLLVADLFLGSRYGFQGAKEQLEFRQSGRRETSLSKCTFCALLVSFRMSSTARLLACIFPSTLLSHSDLSQKNQECQVSRLPLLLYFPASH